ncbi:unnamed protein product, partial [Trichogramma brassicae]
MVHVVFTRRQCGVSRVSSKGARSRVALENRFHARRYTTSSERHLEAGSLASRIQGCPLDAPLRPRRNISQAGYSRAAARHIDLFSRYTG